MGKRVMSFLLGFMLIITYVSSAVAAKGASKFQYDTKGRLIEMVDSEGTIQYQYDENGNLIRKNKTNNLLMNPSFDIYLGTNNVADSWGAWKNNVNLPTSSEIVQWPVDSGIRAQKMSASSLPQGNLFVLAQ
uniref:RHS repeat domain-containing protein n=1 Tax=Paenibacillus elgii TaxID=189691 RepID=UPI000248BFFF